MRDHKNRIPGVLIMFVMSTLLVLVWSASAQAQRAQALVSTAPVVTQQPPYSDYKGVRLGMTAQEVRTKLGAPTMKSDEQDYFVLSDKETAQVGYDAAGKVKVISFDYMGGI
jgi:outer membrane protein assembly factor BamE (lipoprotein component of BamABCDE complex)